MSASGLVTVAAPIVVAESAQLTWTAALMAWVLAVPAFFVTKYLNTVAHEGGHALMAKLLFRKLKAIRFSADGSGATSFADKLPWLVDIFVTLAGYLGPSLFGLLGAWLLINGHTQVVLWTSLVFLFLMLFAVRGVLGWLLVPALMVLIAYVAIHVEPHLQELFAYVWVWFLLIVAVETMFHHMQHKIYKVPGSDTAEMKRLTMLPGVLWGGVFLLGTIAALLYGGAMLLDLNIDVDIEPR